MQKKTSLAILCATVLCVVYLHVEWVPADNGSLLVIDGRKIDLLGIADNRWNQITRNCDALVRLAPSDDKYQTALSLIKEYSPPDSVSAKIASAWTLGSWTLVEVEFEELLPAVVMIRASENESFIVPSAIWSGYTVPWKSAPYIRRYLSQQAPEAPKSLTNCFDPQSSSFK